ncbi:uncharacterized protein LOC109795254 [Cajanus cajan]|uniref:Uncharacterized protein n=1 Tax=Cajanus cajan TaxID=3821 RepID=A0A151U040_CAJCA|nr:uncharacterized protein LOC109795254 [Cajanus cajan]KYP72667.1 hypothetical protein KK1_005265 [Cajanus cajan]
MKGPLCVADTNNFSTSLSLSNSNNPLIPCQPQTLFSPGSVRGLNFKFNISWPRHASCVVQRQKNNSNDGNGFVVGCAKWGLEREVEAEMKQHEDEEKGGSGMGRFRHKCGERKGVVELLECLEKEAIMGEDVGKEPTDYNRRAQIFDRSSQVFQTLKELNNDVSP